MANQKNSPLLPNRVYLPIRLKVMVRDWATFCIQPHCSRGGKNSLKNKWGTRKSEDNWRRSAKSYNQTEADPVDEVNKGVNESADITDAEYKRIMADVPLNSFQKEQYRTEMKKRCLRLAKTTVIKFRSISFLLMWFENWSKTFPDRVWGRGLLLPLYELYRPQNTAMADRYKSFAAEQIPGW